MEHPTSAPASSFWPTPTASSYGSSNNGCPGDGREEYATRGKPSLEAMARGGMWATPTASPGSNRTGKEPPSVSDGRGRGKHLSAQALASSWPTPVANDWKSGHYDGGVEGRPLREVALRSMWPTATAGDAKASGSRNKAGSSANQGTSFTDAILRAGSSHQGRPPSMAGMVLNPRFVERMMGFPDGWSEPDSQRWGTQLSLTLPPVPG